MARCRTARATARRSAGTAGTSPSCRRPANLVSGDGNRATDIFLFDAQQRIDRAGQPDQRRRDRPTARAASRRCPPTAASSLFQSDASDLTCGAAMPAAGPRHQPRSPTSSRPIGASGASGGSAPAAIPGWSRASRPRSTAPARSSRFRRATRAMRDDEGDDFDLFVGGMNKGTGAASKDEAHDCRQPAPRHPDRPARPDQGERTSARSPSSCSRSASAA